MDYPDRKTGSQAVADRTCEKGILICGSGDRNNITQTDTRCPRCPLPEYRYSQLSRMHNDANILVLAGRFTAIPYAIEIVQTFLSTSFEGGRHQKRVDKIEK